VKDGGHDRPPHVLRLASVRDYDTPTLGVPPIAHIDADGRRIVGQTWTCAPDSSTVTIDLFILTQQEDDWAATVRTTVYRAWRRADLTTALTAAGFTDVEWHTPPD
jgi:glycine/sarcosine N-methyltransferase